MDREEGAEKVGAGDTAFCVGCGLPLAQALGKTDARKCLVGLLDDGAERKEDAKWFAETYLKIRASSIAKENELLAKIESAIRESVAEALQEARLQLEKETETLLRSIQKRARSLQCLQPGLEGVQELLEDVLLLSEAIGRTP